MHAPKAVKHVTTAATANNNVQKEGRITGLPLQKKSDVRRENVYIAFLLPIALSSTNRMITKSMLLFYYKTLYNKYNSFSYAIPL